jgi:hypothetical protein
MFDDYLVVYKQLGDLMFYVTGALAENELILNAVLTAFYEATSTLLRWVVGPAEGSCGKQLGGSQANRLTRLAQQKQAWAR